MESQTLMNTDADILFLLIFQLAKDLSESAQKESLGLFETKVLSYCVTYCIHRGYYMGVTRYEFYLQVLKKISHE